MRSRNSTPLLAMREGSNPSLKGRSFLRLFQLIAGLAVLGAWILAAAQTITYSYDTNGRLICVTNASGTTTVYNYDTMGNVTSIANGTCPVTQPTAAPSSTPPAPVAAPTP